MTLLVGHGDVGLDAGDLALQVDEAIRAVAGAGAVDADRRRGVGLALVHRWVARQHREDVTCTVRTLDAWAAALNRAGASPGRVVRVGLRLRTA